MPWSGGRSLTRPQRYAAALTVTLGLAAPLAAEPLLSEGEFRTHTEGRTFYTALDGEIYGIERYLEGRRVIWSRLDAVDEASCVYGRWYQEQTMICYEYQDQDGRHCFEHWLEDGVLAARSMRPDGTQREGYRDLETTDPLPCLGPSVGS